ncbi:interleukin-6 isoform X1 [Bubalus bubalis]|uniref:interleukin-6 isoform X1 n=1 Tax=Bubalus bubalis TaxID=89462 RepID=UPI001D10141C|nr:interleukin-6 isoform X1 [Bubalus bubalis]
MPQDPPLTYYQRGAFTPFAVSLGLLLVMTSAFPTPGPLGEDFKNDTTPGRLLLTTPEKTEALIKRMVDKISAMRKEICEKNDECESSKDTLAENKLNLPKMEEKDGCFQSGFNQAICLIRTTAGLLEYQIYLDYLQNEYEGNRENVRDLRKNIRTLIQILKQKIADLITTPATNTDLLEKMQSSNEWVKNAKIILILRNLENFLQFSLRAIRMK